MNQRFYFSICFFFCLLFQTNSICSQIIPGDINADGVVDSLDITRGAQIVVGRPPPATQNEIDAGDLNRNGKIDVQDLMFISNLISGGNNAPVADASASSDSGTVGLPVSLDASLSFDLDGDRLSYRWRQLFGPKVSFKYISHTQMPIDDTTAAVTVFTPLALGHYKLELEVSDANGFSDRDTLKIFVENDPTTRPLAVKGFTWADIWRNIYVPALTPSLKLAKEEMHAEYASFWHFFEVTLENDLPVFLDYPDDTPTRELQKQIIEIYRSQGFKIQWIFIFNYDHDFGFGDREKYYDQWVHEFREKVAGKQAAFLDSLGVEMLAFNDFPSGGFPDSTFNQDVFLPGIDSIMTDVRQNFSGTVGILELIFGPNEGPYESNANYSIIDFGRPEFYRHLYEKFDYAEVSFQPNISSLKDPTVDQLRTNFEFIMDDYVEPFANVIKKPVYLQVIFPSFDGANKSTSLAFTFFFRTDIVLDFQEQVNMYEALFQAIDDEPYIEGIFSRGYWYFDLNYALDEYGNPVFDFDLSTGQRFYYAHHHTVRNKPATQVLRLNYLNR